MTLRDKTCVTGIGETAYVRGSTRSAFELQIESSLRSIADAGLTPKELAWLQENCRYFTKYSDLTEYQRRSRRESDQRTADARGFMGPRDYLRRDLTAIRDRRDALAAEATQVTLDLAAVANLPKPSQKIAYVIPAASSPEAEGEPGFR